MQNWIYKHRYISFFVIFAMYVIFIVCLVEMFLSLGG